MGESELDSNLGRVTLKRITFKSPEDENKTDANAVAAKGTVSPVNPYQRAIDTGNT